MGSTVGLEERALRTALQRHQQNHAIKSTLALQTVKDIRWNNVKSLENLKCLGPGRYMVSAVIIFRNPKFSAKHWFAVDTFEDPPVLSDNLRERVCTFDVIALQNEREDAKAEYYVTTVSKVLKLIKYELQ